MTASDHLRLAFTDGDGDGRTSKAKWASKYGVNEGVELGFGQLSLVARCRRRRARAYGVRGSRVTGLLIHAV